LRNITRTRSLIIRPHRVLRTLYELGTFTYINTHFVHTCVCISVAFTAIESHKSRLIGFRDDPRWPIPLKTLHTAPATLWSDRQINLSRPRRTFSELKAVSVICAEKLKYHYVIIPPRNTRYCTLVGVIANFQISRVKSGIYG